MHQRLSARQVRPSKPALSLTLGRHVFQPEPLQSSPNALLYGIINRWLRTSIALFLGSPPFLFTIEFQLGKAIH